MMKQVNGPQNREQLLLMIDVVRREVNLAQDLLNSYQEDLAQLELNSLISVEEKEAKRVFIETAIKESKELLSIRRKQLKAIDISRSGRAARDARIKTWRDKSLESKGMNAIISEMEKKKKEQKHQEDLKSKRQERQKRSENIKVTESRNGSENFEIRLFTEPQANLESKISQNNKNSLINGFQKLKLWFMRLFNKNYRLTEARNDAIYLPDEKENKEAQKNNKKEEKKRTIKGFSKPKVKQFFKDYKNEILALSAVTLASLALAFGINAQKDYNRQIIEQKAAEAQREAEMEAQREKEEQQALADAAKEQEQDKLLFHDGNTLTTGTIEKQYYANAGLEYTADSTGRGTRGALGQDTVVEIFNRAIVRENEDGTKEILLSTNGKTWEEHAKDTGMSIDEINNMLKKGNTYEMVAIQVGETNHNIFNTYGWIKATDLKESSKGTESLKNFEITFGDNVEILKELQQKENLNQNQQEER